MGSCDFPLYTHTDTQTRQWILRGEANPLLPLASFYLDLEEKRPLLCFSSHCPVFQAAFKMPMGPCGERCLQIYPKLCVFVLGVWEVESQVAAQPPQLHHICPEFLFPRSFCLSLPLLFPGHLPKEILSSPTWLHASLSPPRLELCAPTFLLTICAELLLSTLKEIPIP